MARQVYRVILVMLVCSVVALRAPAQATVAQTDNGLDVIRAAYNITLDKYFRPLNPAELLQGAWDQVSSALSDSDVPPPPPLPALTTDRDAAFSAFAGVYTTWISTLPADIKPANVGFAVTAAMLESLNDAHTAFIPPSNAQRNAADSASDQPVGIGIRTANRSQLFITEIAPGGPAERAGLKAGDVIVAINGTDVNTVASLLQAAGQSTSRLLAGRNNTTITLGIQRGDQNLDITVTRGPFYFPPLSTRMLAGGVGYLRLTDFVGVHAPQRDGLRVLDELDRDLSQFDAQQATGLIVDLRDNPGGYAVDEWLGRFLPENTLTYIENDAKGHQSTNLVSGQMHATQLPMAVIVNGNSYSASEEFAATMHETGRALIVGRQTGGGLRAAQTLSLPNGASMEVAVADVTTAYQHYSPEGKGYPVDVSISDSRTAADYQAGRDPQLEAAVAALPQAPSPPAYFTNFTALTKDQLASTFRPYMPVASQIPVTARLSTITDVGSFDANHVNEAVSGTRDPLALQQTYRQRGWLGAHTESYASKLGSTPDVDVTAELYATPEGAEVGLTTNDAPDSQQFFQSPVKLGDDTVAFRGLWIGAGSVGVSWRRGNVVFTVGYGDAPGFEDMDEVVKVAQVVDQTYSRQPLVSPSIPSGAQALPAAA